MAIDVLIIGSGVAATAISQRLLDKNPKTSILILEAGSCVKTKDYALWENYLVTGQLPYDQFKDLGYPGKDTPGENSSVGGTDMPLAGARILTYGGTTIHWGGWAFRLKPEDFRLRTNSGVGADWPFEYDELEPYYNEAEHYLGISGDSKDPTVPRSQEYPFRAFPYSLQDQPIAQALETLGIGYSNVPIARHGVADTTSKHAPCQTTGTCKYCPFGARYAATNFLNDMIAWNDYPNFEIKTGAVVEEIVMASKRRAAGAVYTVKETGLPVRVEANRVIVAAGSFESAKLLLRTITSEWSKGVGNDNNLLGRNLITHPYFIFSGTSTGNPLRLQPEMNFPTLCTRYYDSEAEQTAGKFILVNPPDSVPVKLASQMQAGMTRAQVDKYVMGLNQIQLHGMIEVFGRFENCIKNMPKLNRFGMPETIVDYTKDVGFDGRIAAIQLHVEKIFKKMGASLQGKPSISWRADHAASVCIMSKSDADGVLDENLQVFGVDNLYVCSNAAFPSIGAVNPTLTLTALALRLGDHLGASTG